MDLLKQFLDENKKPSLKRSAKAVYRRDYLKTRNKSYRKYDAEEHKSVSENYETMSIAQLQQELEYAVEDLRMAKEIGEDADTIATITSDIRQIRGQIEAIKMHSGVSPHLDTEMVEGVFDYAIGAGAHAGSKIKQAASGMAKAGHRASAIGDVERDLVQLVQALQTYDKTKQVPQQSQSSPPPTAPEDNDQQESPAGAPNAGGVADPFKTTGKPKAAVGKHGYEWQFSSYLAQQDNTDFLSEGAWDFIKGAAKQMGSGVAQSVKGVHQAGQQASQEADGIRAKQVAQEKIKAIVNRLASLGSEGPELLQQLTIAKCGPMARRCNTIILNAARKMGVEFN